MAVSKFYAVWRKESGEEEIVNAFQALELTCTDCHDTESTSDSF